MPSALSGQKYYGIVRDRSGNAVSGVTVEVIDNGSQVLLATVTTDDDGGYVVPLTGELSTQRLVDVRLSGPIPTRTITALTLF
jgi:hypothetical protein